MVTSSRINRTARVALIAGIVGLSACGGSSSEDDETVELRLSWWGSQHRGEITQQVIDLFEEQNPGITVTGNYADVGPYWQKIATESAAGNAPDVIQMESDVLRDYSDRGMLRNLEEYGEMLDLSGYQESDLDMGRTDAGLVALPVGALAPVIVANTKVFEDAGVPLPDDSTWSWEDYLSVAREITENTPEGVRGAEALGFEVHGLTIWARQHGEDMWTEDGKVAMSEETLAAFWAMLLECTHSGACAGSEAIVDEVSGSNEESGIVAGNLAMVEEWSHSLPTLYAGSPDDAEYVLLRFPGSAQAAGSQYYKASMYWSVTSQSEHPEEAAALVNFLANDKQAAEIMLADRSVPANDRTREHIDPMLDSGARQGMDFLTEIKAEVGAPAPVAPPGGSEVKAALQRYSAEVIFERLSPDEAAEKFISEVNEVVGD